MEHLIANTAISKRIKAQILPVIEQLGFELIKINYTDAQKATLQVMVDKSNIGIAIAECAVISTNISAILDVDDPIDGEYNLEISSPGINRPLTRKKDFDFWFGHEIKVKTNELIDQRKNFRGILRGVVNDEIRLEIAEGTIGLNFEWIEEANLNISFGDVLKEKKLQEKVLKKTSQ